MTESPALDAATDRPSSVDLALLDLLQRLDQAGTPDAMFEAAEQALLRLAQPDRIAIGTLDPTTRRIRLVRLYGDSLGLPDHYETLPTDEESLIHVPLTQGIPVLHTLHPDKDIYRGDAMRRQHGMQQALIAPVIARGTVTGLMILNSVARDRFSVETVATVESVGRALGLALAACPDPTISTTAGEVISDTLARIVMAETADAVRAGLCHGVERATGAATLLLERSDDGVYRYVSCHPAADPALEAVDIERAGTDIAGAMGRLIDTNVGQATIPQRVIVTGLPLGDDVPARVASPDDLPDLPGVGAAVITPLHAARDVLGALVALLPESVSAEMLPSHARAIFSLSDIAGPALHRLVLVDRLEQRLAETETMRRLTDSIARTPRLQDALDIICRTSRLITGADFVAIAEVTPEHVIWHSASGAHATAFLHQRLPGPAGVLGQLLAHQAAVLIEDARHHPEFSPEAMPVHTAEGLRSTAIVPIYVNARIRAAIVVAWRRPHVFGSEEVSTYHALAATASTALASADARMRADGD